MDTPLWALIGMLAGSLSLIPGLHLSALALVVAPFLLTVTTPMNAAVALVAAAGIALCGHALAVVFHPVTGDNLASADPAQRLAHQGKGLHAIKILTQSLSYSAVGVFAIAGVFLFGHLFRQDYTRAIEPVVSALAGPLILFWLCFTIVRSGKPFATVLAMAVLGAYGFVTTKNPAFTMNGHVLTAVLGGTFAIPMLLSTLRSKGRARALPTNQALPGKESRDDLWIIGPLLGILTGFLPGLGSGSLVSLFESQTESDEDYLTLAGTAESANNLWALVLVLLAGTTRSGDAVALRFALPEPDLAAIIILLVVLGLSLTVGIHLAHRLAPWYASVITRFPLKTQAILLLVLMIGTILWQCGPLGLGVAAVGALCGTYARTQRLPNQVNFAVLIVPVILYSFGVAGPLGTALFGS